MYYLDQLPGRSVQINGQEWLHFSGTAYLGIPHLEGFKGLLLEGMAKYGTNFGGSRRSNTRLNIFEEAEAFLAAWLGTEASITISSGTLAGQLLARYLEAQQWKVWAAPDAHPAIISKALIFKGHRSDWIDHILRYPYTDTAAPLVLISNAIDPLRAQAFDWQWINLLPAEQAFLIIIDESHSIGLLGPKGSGVGASLPQRANVEYVFMGSLGKALGTPAGFIAGSHDLVRQIWEQDFFGGASPAIPAYLYAWLQAQDLFEIQRNKLKVLHEFFSTKPIVKELFKNVPTHPVFYTPNQQLADLLQKHRILVSAFPYPGPNDPLVTRVVLNALHKIEDITYLLNALPANV